MAATIDSLSRVSRVNGRDLQSARLQHEANLRAIETHGYGLGEHVEALNKSGGLIATGEQWQRALERVRRGASAGVAVPYVDRLSRDVATGLAWVDALGLAGGILISGGRIINMANPHERAAFINELNMGELQLNVYREKNREVMADVKRRGILNRLPYGYQRNQAPDGGRLDERRDRKALVIDPEQAASVRLIFAMRAAGERWPAIVAALRAQGTPSPTGQPYWAASTLSSLVKSRVYRGEVHMGGHVTHGAHEPIVSEQLWREAQSSAKRVRTGKNKPGAAHGLLVCSGCGGPLQVQRAGHGGTFYGCRRSSSQGPCPAPVNGDQAKLDAYVDELVAGALDGDHIDAVRARRDLSDAQTAMTEARDNRAAFLKGTRGLDADTIAEALADLNADVERTERAYQDALAAAAVADDLPASADAYHRLPLARRQRVAALLIRRVTLDPFPKGAGRRGANPADRTRVEWA